MFATAMVLGACGGGGGATTPPPNVGPTDVQVRVSGPSPFAAGCQGAVLGGTVYAGAEVEPYVAINPLDANNLVGVWQQDRWSDAGASGLLTGVSFDGGRTWTPRMAAFSRCTGGTPQNGGDYERASDPWITFAPDGTAYQIAIAFSGQSSVPASGNAVLVSRSVDGGRSWSDPVTLIRDGSDAFNDKESITADPTDARYVYAVWDRLVPGTGPTMLSRTTDGGRTWEPARPIHDPGAGSQTINNQVVVLPDGTLVDFFTRFDAAGGASLVVIRSTDKGVTWSAPIVIAAVRALGARDAATGTAIRDGANLGSIDAGRNGTLAAVWQDSRFSGGVRDGIAFSRSTDGGRTWTAPVGINGVPEAQAFLPAVRVAADGTFGVSYFDLRNNTDDPATLPADIWLVRSADGVLWQETHVSGPFDLALAPNSHGLFVGDYHALASIGSDFVPFYAQTNTGDASNPTDVFVSLTVSGTMSTVAKAADVDRSMAAADGGTTFRARVAPPFAASDDVAQRLVESVARTRERRLAGRAPDGR